MNRKTVLAVVLSVATFSAWAAEPAPAETIQANPCKTPDLSAIGTSLTKEQADTINANNKAYQECVQNYVNQQQALGNAHLQAAQDAAKQFNDYMKALNAKLGKSDSGKEKQTP
jgi:peptidoglycan hydrolase CwlO-like protein